MKTHITIENLDKIKGASLQDRYGIDWYLDKVTNGKETYSFHFTNQYQNKGSRVIELKRDMHDAGCWRISSYNSFDLVPMKTLKDPTLMISAFSNLLT